MSPWRNSDVLHFEERVVLAPDGEQRISDHTEFSGMYPALQNTFQTSKADEALPSNGSPQICRYGPTWPVKENRVRKHLHSDHNRLVY